MGGLRPPIKKSLHQYHYQPPIEFWVLRNWSVDLY